ncbi:multidrug resistance [Fusarium agapanthi]|uniref:Multidrug resistance n=1 Tax=Fusarium agapanthi TaxID=1803897 RepID=A0A9P5E9Y9_9HYPO|nr:multidrug resistance [Fusarium agapanthi]
MTVTEVGCMGVKPDMNIMDHTTPEGKILTDAWNTVIRKPANWYRYGADAVKDIPKICTHGEFTKHIKMIPSSGVLGSPLTEIVLTYFPQDISEEKKGTLSSKIPEILRQTFPGEARVAHAWGVENDFPARSEDGVPRSVLMGFVGLSRSETWGDYRQTDGWKEALSTSGEGLRTSLSCRASIVQVSRNTLVFTTFGTFSCIGFYSGIFFGALSAEFLGWKWSHEYPWLDLEMDWLGTATVVPVLASVVYALTDGGNAPYPYVALILGITCLALFVYVERWRASKPLIPAVVFNTKYMSRLIVALFVSYGSLSLVLCYASFYIESVLYTGPLLTTSWFIRLAAGGFILAVIGGFALHILNGRQFLIIFCLGFLGSSILFPIIPDSRISNTFLGWTFVFPAMILAIVGVDITFNIHNFIIATSLPNHLQALGGALITSLLYLGMAFWLGVVEMATSAQKEVKGAENLDATSQCQIMFWTGTGLALIFITVQI